MESNSDSGTLLFCHFGATRAWKLTGVFSFRFFPPPGGDLPAVGRPGEPWVEASRATPTVACEQTQAADKGRGDQKRGASELQSLQKWAYLKIGVA